MYYKKSSCQQTLVISDALPMKLHAVNSTSFRLLCCSTIRVEHRVDFCRTVAVAEKNITLSPFRKLVRPVVPSDIPGDQYFEYVTANIYLFYFFRFV